METILRGKKLGFTLAEIMSLIGGNQTNGKSDLEDQLQPDQIVAQIDHLERRRDEIDGAIQYLRTTYPRLPRSEPDAETARRSVA